jgi:hypothetical protein
LEATVRGLEESDPNEGLAGEALRHVHLILGELVERSELKGDEDIEQALVRLDQLAHLLS